MLLKEQSRSRQKLTVVPGCKAVSSLVLTPERPRAEACAPLPLPPRLDIHSPAATPRAQRSPFLCASPAVQRSCF